MPGADNEGEEEFEQPQQPPMQQQPQQQQRLFGVSPFTIVVLI